MIIRPATDRDAHAISQCLAEAFEPYRAQYTAGAFTDTVLTADSAHERMKHMTILVAEHASAIVGTIGYEAGTRGEGHLRGMAVQRAAQGSGLAHRLLSAAESALRDAGCDRVTLDTTRPLTRAIAFYQRHGYVTTGVISDFYGMELIEYSKDL